MDLSGFGAKLYIHNKDQKVALALLKSLGTPALGQIHRHSLHFKTKYKLIDSLIPLSRFT